MATSSHMEQPKIQPVTATPRSQQDDGGIVKHLDDTDSIGDNSMKKIITGVYIILIVLGIGTGYLLSGRIQGSGSNTTSTSINDGKTVGSTDTKTFKDSAFGTIEKGGFEGEGTHKLVREGGESQTVYLISSVVDLDQYAGKKVKVWGQTQAAQNVAWLMDVGKVELSE